MNRRSTKSGKRFHSLEHPDELKRYNTYDNHSIERATSNSRSTAPKTTLPTLQKTRQRKTKRNFFKDSPETNTIERYQKYLLDKEEHFHMKNLHEYKEKKKLESGGMRVKTQISSLAKQIHQIRMEINQDHDSKIYLQNKILSELVDHIHEKQRYAPQVPPVSQMMPIYVPFPMSLPLQQPHFPLQQSHFPSQQPYFPPQQPQEYYRNPEQYRRMPTEYKKTATVKRYFGRGRQKTIALWKKAANCILFPIYLKRFCKIARQTRKKMFTKFFNALPSKLGKVKEIVVRGLRSFMKQINRDIIDGSLEIKKTDSPQSRAQKIKAVKKQVNLILQGLQSEFKANENNPDLFESLYYLCKHGNYSCTEALLTKEELELTSISEAFHYVSADYHLEKSALINLILIKLLLFNTLFSKNMEKDLKNKQSLSNIHIIGSVLYELIMDVQNEIMQGVPISYPLGNYRQEKYQVRGLQSMVIGGGKPEEGKLISGLMESELIKQTFKLNVWKRQKNKIVELIQMEHELIKKYHLKVIVRYK